MRKVDDGMDSFKEIYNIYLRFIYVLIVGSIFDDKILKEMLVEVFGFFNFIMFFFFFSDKFGGKLIN